MMFRLKMALVGTLSPPVWQPVQDEIRIEAHGDRVRSLQPDAAQLSGVL